MHDQSLHSYLILTTPWTVAHQAPLSMEFSRQEYWSGLPCLPPGDLPHPGIELTSLMSPALLGDFLTSRIIWAFNVFILPSFLKGIFTMFRILGWHFFKCFKDVPPPSFTLH